MVEYEVVECKKNTQLPRTPVWGYGVMDVKEAVSEHKQKGRGEPAKVFVFQKEVYIPVEGV